MAGVKYRPSDAHRWMSCPGAPRAEAAFPSAPSAHAVEGIEAHELAAKWLLQDASDASPPKGYPTDMVKHVGKYIRYIRGIFDELEGALMGPVMSIEHSLALDDSTGVADCLIRTPRELHVFDLKYGAGVAVDAKDNPQLLRYAAAVLNLPDIDGFLLEEVHLHICQPRTTGGFTTAVYTVTEVMEWLNGTYLPALKAAKVEDAPRQPGEHCRFCRAAATCPALAASAIRTDLISTPVGELTDAQMAEAMDAYELAKLWYSAAERRTMSLLMSGRDVPGYELVKTQRRRQLTDPAGFAFAMDAEGIPLEDYANISPKGLSDLEDMLGRDRYELLVAPFVGYTEPGPKIARKGGKAEPWKQPAPADVFSDFITATDSGTNTINNG